MDGDMSEDQKGCAVLKEVDNVVFDSLSGLMAQSWEGTS